MNLLKTSDVIFRRRPEPAPETLRSGRLADNAAPPYKFAYARTALKFGLKSAGILQGKSLLVPEFVCESLVEPLRQLEIRPLYYPVDTGLEPDWEFLDRAVLPTTSGLVVVHYFGQPQDLRQCMTFCRDRQLLLIEDNAHGFGGEWNDALLGTIGDIGISAPRKCFPIPGGAYLYVSNDLRIELEHLHVQPNPTLGRRRRVKKWLRRTPLVRSAIRYRAHVRDTRRRLGSPPDYGSQSAFREPPVEMDYGMDLQVDAFLCDQDIESIRSARQEIYAIWQQWAVENGLKPVFSTLAPKASPLVFPAYTSSATESLRWFERGHRAGIDIHSWPTLPWEIVEKDGHAMRQWERLVCFPIHQEMAPSALRDRLRTL